MHGLGETALPLVPAALGNALRSLGAAQQRMPVSPEAILAALDAAGSAVNLRLTLNAQERSFEIAGDEPLIDVLRDAGLASVRLGCGVGLCGACTVLLDGEPVSSCLLHAGTRRGPPSHDGRGTRRGRPRAARVRRGRGVPVRLLHAGNGAVGAGPRGRATPAPAPRACATG